MKRITSIAIENYRAFYQQYKPILLPKGENLLLYGENGSGKSSLFKALSNYFSSSQDPAFLYTKNYHSLSTNGLLRITFEDYTLSTNTINPGTAHVFDFSSLAGASTTNVAFIKDTEFIKGFLDYRSLLDVYNHKDPRPNLFKLIVTELLLHYTPTGGTYAFGERWLWLIPEMRDVFNRNTLKHRNAKNTLPIFQASLEDSLRRIFLQLNKLLMQYFSFNLRVWFTLKPIVYQYDWNNWHPIADLRLDLMLNGVSITNQQDYLNEARLSALSICLYLAAVLQNPSYTGFDYKILYLDDIFVGLDAGNRIPILKILKEKFLDYQLFISTYDRHWFELARNYFEVEAPERWKTVEFYVGKDSVGKTEFEKPIVVQGENNFEKAVKFLHHRSKPDYPAAANYFRKALEEIIKNHVPPYEKVAANFTQVPDHKLTKLVFNTKNFLNKTGNSTIHINAIAGLLSDLMHPLSHHQIASPVYKRELQILQTEIPKLKRQLISISYASNIKCMLETKKQLKFTFTVDIVNAHFLFYDIVLQENLLKTLNAGGLPTVSLCNCRATKGYGTKNGKALPSVPIGKNNPIFNYNSLKDAYDNIHAYWVTRIGPFPVEVNYLDAIQYHDGTIWQPINNILPW